MKKLFLLVTAIAFFSLASTQSFAQKVGMAGWSFVNFDITKTLETLDRVGVKYLCVKDFHLPLNSTKEDMAKFKELLASYDVTPYAVGPIYMRDKAQIDVAFDYAQRLGVDMIVGVPNYELLPYVNEKVKATGLYYAIHLHGPDQKLYPNATDIWENVKNLDPKMGICLDIGHDLRDGEDPIADLKKYHTRVFDIHIKDVTAPTKAGVAIELGRGLIDFPEFAKALKKVKYDRVCSLEYEKDMKDPFLGIAESIGFFKGVMRSVE